MWCDHCPESELAVTQFAISVIKADYCERFCVHIRVIVSWEEWENMICFRFILSVTWLGNLELARRWRACVPKTPTHCTVPPLLTAVAQPNTHTHRRDDSAPCVVAWLRRSSVCIKVTESYHRYYMTPWKQYVLPLCPRLIFEHTRRHRQQSALVAYWFIVEWVSVFSIHHSVARQHVYVSLLARVCVSVCLCLCGIMSECVFPEMRCCSRHGAIQSTGCQWEGSGQPSCPVLLKKRLVVLFYALLKQCYQKLRSINTTWLLTKEEMEFSSWTLSYTNTVYSLIFYPFPAIIFD